MIKQRLRRIESFLNSCATPVGTSPPPPRRLQTVQDVINLLEEQVQVVRAAPWAGPLDKARAIAYLAGVARKTIEAGVLAARIEMLETVLNQRKEHKKP
jgi:hypothetical protein